MKEWQHKGAFVIQFQIETDIDAGRLKGRVEHVASSQSTHFHSLDELVMFMNRILKETRVVVDVQSQD